MGPLRSPILTTLTLSISIPNPSLKVIARGNLHLPVLRHLHITSSRYEDIGEYDEPCWMPFIRLIGSNLRTLRVTRESHYLKEIPGEIWSICPKVEHLHLDGQRTTIPPPDNHPIHTLSISYWDIWMGDPLHEYVPDWPGLRTVRMDYDWDDTLDDSQLEQFDQRLRLEGAKGESYEDYLSVGQSRPRNPRAKYGPHMALFG
ncbi:hypothetical protein CPB86DRAFT_778596 [Serendipita vermifera]|nr:hypothetical protein CPB86DRAFT_778596 [Serendipita vermifera]